MNMDGGQHKGECLEGATTLGVPTGRAREGQTWVASCALPLCDPTIVSVRAASGKDRNTPQHPHGLNAARTTAHQVAEGGQAGALHCLRVLVVPDGAEKNLHAPSPSNGRLRIRCTLRGGSEHSVV